MSLPALILAAGASRRLGRPKQLEPLDGEALIHRTARVVLEAGYGPVLVVLGAGAEAIRPVLEDLDVGILVNEAWEEGMASSIRQGVSHLAPEAPGVLLLVCDQTALHPGILGRLARAFEADPTRPVAASYEGILGVPAILPASDFPHLSVLTGDSGARNLLRDGRTRGESWEDGAKDFDLASDRRA